MRGIIEVRARVSIQIGVILFLLIKLEWLVIFIIKRYLKLRYINIKAGLDNSSRYLRKGLRGINSARIQIFRKKIEKGGRPMRENMISVSSPPSPRVEGPHRVSRFESQIRITLMVNSK